MSAGFLSAAAEREWLGKGLLDGLPLIVLMAARNAIANNRLGKGADFSNPLDLPPPMLDEPRLLKEEGFSDRRAIYAAHVPALVAGYTSPPEDVAFIELGRALGVTEATLELVGDLLLIERLTPDLLAEVLVEDEKRANSLTNH